MTRKPGGVVVSFFISISHCKAAEKACEKRTGDKMLRKRDKWGDRGITGTGFLWQTTHNRLRSVTAEKLPVWSQAMSFFPLTVLNGFVVKCILSNFKVNKNSKVFVIYIFFIFDFKIIIDLFFFNCISTYLYSKCISLGYRHHMLWCLNTSHAI